MSAVSMLQNEGRSVTFTARRHASPPPVPVSRMMCLQLNVVKTMWVRVRTKTMVERLAVRGPRGMPNLCVRIRVTALALVHVTSVPTTMGTERDSMRPESPKTQKAAMVKTLRSRKRLRWITSMI